MPATPGAPPTYPMVAAALNAGELPVDSANHIITQLGQASPRAEAGHLVEAERVLVEYAATAVADDVRAVAVRWRDALDVDGIEPREETLIAARSLKRLLLSNGLKRFVLDPLNAAYLDTAVDAEVTATIRKVRFVDETVTGDLAEIDPRTLTQMGPTSSSTSPVTHCPPPTPQQWWVRDLGPSNLDNGAFFAPETLTRYTGTGGRSDFTGTGSGSSRPRTSTSTNTQTQRTATSAPTRVKGAPPTPVLYSVGR